MTDKELEDIRQAAAVISRRIDEANAELRYQRRRLFNLQKECTHPNRTFARDWDIKVTNCPDCLFEEIR